MLWTALLLGLLGSIHCAAMCGPLILAVPMEGRGGSRIPYGRCIYHAGRIGVYGIFGLVFGLVGETVRLAGWQRWSSLVAGAMILAGLATAGRLPLRTPAFRLAYWMKARFGGLLASKSRASILILGGLNGFLPCGLVYAAAIASAASGGVPEGIVYMVAFGLGTLPMLLSLGAIQRRLTRALGPNARRLVPAGLAMVGLLLLCRGLALGIPYLSPAEVEGQTRCPACEAQLDVKRSSAGPPPKR